MKQIPFAEAWWALGRQAMSAGQIYRAMACGLNGWPRPLRHERQAYNLLKMEALLWFVIHVVRVRLGLEPMAKGKSPADYERLRAMEMGGQS